MTSATNHPASSSSSSSPLSSEASTPAGGGGAGCWRESVLRFLLLPRQIGVVLLLEFLNSFRSFGLRFVLYNYVTNEFGIGDARAGALLGVKGFVDIAFGLLGSVLVDVHGVRKVSMISLSIAVVGRTLIAFGRTRTSLFLALYLLSPCGDALLSIGLYKVALKKLTTPLTRPLAFALSYSAFNLAGGLADVLIDAFRGGLEDASVGAGSFPFGLLAGVYTPVRQFVVLTWVVLLLTWVIAYCLLEDLTVIDANDPEDGGIANAIRHRDDGGRGGVDDDAWQEESEEVGRLYGGANDNDGYAATPAEPMVRSRLLRRWFPNQYQALDYFGDDETNDPSAIGRATSGAATARRRLPDYKMHKTRCNNTRAKEGGGSGASSSLRFRVTSFFNRVVIILRMRATWRVMVFGFATSTIAMNWTASEMVLPAFLERRFGELTPIYIIQSINLFGCLVLPPLVGAYTSGREDFAVFMPGLWIMAISPIFMAMSPNVIGACAWQVVMTIGEVLWSPRQGSWTASLAPTGSEGLFFAVSSSRSVFGPLTDFLMGALNDRYNANCPECRDAYGHFCHSLSPGDDGSRLQCASVQESCNVFLDNDQQSCPVTCLQCPTWEPIDPSICWYLLLVVSVVSPLCIWSFLPFLRGNRSRDDNCYGLLSFNKNRFSGIYGAMEDGDDKHRSLDGCQSYGHVGDFDNEDGYNKRKISLGDDVELT